MVSVKSTEKLAADRIIKIMTMKLTEETINTADEVIKIKSIDELSAKLQNIALQIATASVKHNGFYGYTRTSDGMRVLFILEGGEK